MGPLATALMDWSGPALVVVSLVFLVRKSPAYWHWSNASLLPFFLLFLSQRQLMLAGLQVTYLVFGLHGLLLWKLEARRDAGDRGFDERLWYRAGWMMSLAIFALTIVATPFDDAWAFVQLGIVALSLLANWATSRRWTWSWPAWLVVNAAQAVYFAHLRLAGQVALQFVLFALSVHGWRTWRRDDRRDAREGLREAA